MENSSQKKIEPLDMNAYQEKKCKWSLNGDVTNDPHLHVAPYSYLILE